MTLVELEFTYFSKESENKVISLEEFFHSQKNSQKDINIETNNLPVQYVWGKLVY